MHDDVFSMPAAITHRMREVARRLALTYLHEPTCWVRFDPTEDFQFAWPEPEPPALLYELILHDNEPREELVVRLERDPRFASLRDEWGRFLPGARERFDEDYQAMRTYTEARDLLRVLDDARREAARLLDAWGGAPHTAFRYGGHFVPLMPRALVPELHRFDDERCHDGSGDDGFADDARFSP